MSELRVQSPIKNRISSAFIPVRNIENARDWYCKLLGVAPVGDILFEHLYALPMDGTSLVLDQMPMWGGNEPDGPPTYQTPAFMFHTDNVQALI